MPAPESNNVLALKFLPVFPSISITINPQILKSPFVFISAISDLFNFGVLIFASVSIPMLVLNAGVMSEIATNFHAFTIQLPGCVSPSHVIVS